MPDFDASPLRFTSTRAGIASLAAADSESSEWHSSQIALTVFALRLWRCPMKCQRKASPYRACLASRSCARFSPTTSTPASARAARSSIATYFVATTIVTASPTSARALSYRSRSSSTDVGNDSLPAGSTLVAPVREEPVGIARRADVETVDPLDAGGAEGALGRRPQIEPPVARDVVTERLAERNRHLLPHLVAARADARADRRREPARPGPPPAGRAD